MVRYMQLAATAGVTTTVLIHKTCLDTAERYDPATNKWELIASLSEGRRALSVVALPDGIYAIGGYSGKNYLASVERYDIEQNVWTRV
jgi:N-acetylneuraminic acid mutarotase